VIVRYESFSTPATVSSEVKRVNKKIMGLAVWCLLGGATIESNREVQAVCEARSRIMQQMGFHILFEREAELWVPNGSATQERKVAPHLTACDLNHFVALMIKQHRSVRMADGRTARRIQTAKGSLCL
jgi:hypothetical protein